MWDGEIAMLEAVPYAIKEHKNIIVASGNSLGKDFTCGGLVHYFLEAWGPCVVITTAPSDRQVKKIMWGEIASHAARAKIPTIGQLLTEEIKIGPDKDKGIEDQWYALGFTTKETGNMVGKFQGFHSPRVFVIVSEAQAVDDTIYEQIEAILTGEIGLMIQIGNPLRASGRFASDIKAKKDIVITLNCLDNPNYIEKKTVVPGLCSYAWVEDKRTRWGEDDPRWAARILGQIPKTSIDTVFGQDLIDRMVNWETKETRNFKGVAIDVARFGDDETVIYGGQSGMVKEKEIKTGQATTTTAARGVIVLRKVGGNFIVVDGDGVGGGTVDTLNDMELKGVDIIEVHGAGKPTDISYQNLKAEMWFIARKRAEDGNASIPNDPLLIEELLEVKFFINKKGLIQIEEKEDVKERLGRSPDRADAWVMLQYGFENATQIRGKEYGEEEPDEHEGVSAPAGGAMSA